MIKVGRNIFFLVISFVLLLSVTSCLDDEIENRSAEAQSKLDEYLKKNNYKDAEHIGYGIYLRIEEGADLSKPKPKYPNTIRVNYTGKFTDGSVFETTDSEEGQILKYHKYLIYGSKRFKLGSLIFGFDTAMRKIPEGAKAQIVIPHQYAFSDFNPVVYDVELLEIIENDSAWEADVFERYVETHGFDTSRKIAPGIYYKTEGGIDSSGVASNDSVTIELTGRFAEFEFEGENTGRVFYPRPIDGESTTIPAIYKYSWGGPERYPIITAIDSTIKYMNLEQTMDILIMSGAEGPDDWGYGNVGLTNELGSSLIPPYTPLHYTIKLLEIEKN